ncbi:MAG: LytTR family transcriptional regulator DNA-binding domain-containing protein [Saprospiraceae bacterium]|nr:LytTR family transcriptional regulator DNA-binding domain-containing protein [Saprospiraceae bacterium]MCF8251600.1 LytTR family transcriptional regulator DNA-binding domain-containing protein [Saprospiraceae bacterium]MCF8282062.1 LytTR family transcriptional regulator DNA-binding domain-containing protein [Bacteroidales bacterium]MCF8313495.1 LytTR family transcriptional regulator DNA-binding domain-containing protein [Saprospiraceae bacterium]MCF8442236.1 LytTR family transcriptional regu
MKNFAAYTDSLKAATAWPLRSAPMAKSIYRIHAGPVGSHKGPPAFFSINRQAIVEPDAIRRISTWFNSRLKLVLLPAHETNNVVSREWV